MALVGRSLSNTALSTPRLIRLVVSSVAMANELKETDLRRYAVLGAEARLLQIAEEAAAIYKVFPELRDSQNGNAKSHGESRQSDPSDGRPQRKRRSMDADQRNAVSERMKRYWAERRAAAEQKEAAAKSKSSKTRRSRKERAKAA